jgi:ABC-type transporter Mla MlaB component
VNKNVFLNEKIQTIEVNGSIFFDNVLDFLEQSRLLLQHQKAIKIDLKGVVQGDSSVLALLTAWVREAKKQHKSIQFIHAPKFMQAILNVCGLEGVLPVLWEN